MKITDEMRIALEEAAYENGRETDAMIAAVAPLILEQAALLAQVYANKYDAMTGDRITAAIRGLKVFSEE